MGGFCDLHEPGMSLAGEHNSAVLGRQRHRRKDAEEKGSDEGKEGKERLGQNPGEVQRNGVI